MVIVFRIAWLVTITAISYLATTATQQGFEISQVDKINHFVAFLVLAFLTHFAFPGKRTYTHVFMLLCFAVAIEVTQYSIPHRHFSVYDIVADLAGIIVFYIGLAFTKKMKQLFKR